MQVKLITTTRWEGKLCRPGDVLDVDPAVAARWRRNQIAVPVESEEEPVGELEQLTLKQLQKIATDKGFVPGNLRKADLIMMIHGDKLEEFDGPEDEELTEYDGE